MNGLPTVPVDDIRVQPAYNDLLIGTHGRGIWVLDDIAPLEQLASGSVMAGTPYLFLGGQAIQWRRRSIQEWTASAEFNTSQPACCSTYPLLDPQRVQGPSARDQDPYRHGAGRTND